MSKTSTIRYFQKIEKTRSNLIKLLEFIHDIHPLSRNSPKQVEMIIARSIESYDMDWKQPEFYDEDDDEDVMSSFVYNINHEYKVAEIYNYFLNNFINQYIKWINVLHNPTQHNPIITQPQ